MDRFIGILGVIVILGIAYLFSENKKKINWRLVATGLGLQIIFALIILIVPFDIKEIKNENNFITRILDFTAEGTTFLFGNLTDQATFGSIFALNVLPTIIFFSALMGILYYLGINKLFLK